MKGELNEQELIFSYMKPGSRVLEFGGNIGRSSVVISKILGNTGAHVVFESDPMSASRLKENRDRNNLHFSIINAALSEHPMVQKGWDTKVVKPGEKAPAGWNPVRTIPWDEFHALFPYNFDVLVVDCEGCLDPILQSYPHLLKHIKLIILENDANVPANHKIHAVLHKYGFASVYCRAGINKNKDKQCFFQVLKKKIMKIKYKIFPE